MRFYNLVSLPLSPLFSFLCVWVISWHPAARPYFCFPDIVAAVPLELYARPHSCFPDMVDSVPLNLYAKINPFLLMVCQVLLSYHMQSMQPIRTACRRRQENSDTTLVTLLTLLNKDSEYCCILHLNVLLTVIIAKALNG